MKSKSNISNNIPQKGRRVFISFIGTNNYKWTYYSFGEEWKSPKPVRFIQEALISMLCADWTEKDQIYIFRTEKARVLNWIDKPDVTGLESTLRQMDLKVPFKDIEIKEGFSEKDVWDIFNSIYSQLQPDDQIYLDVTHAFRSIPMFSTILFNYSKMMLHTETRAIYYGAFEKMGSGPEVDKIPVEKRDAPILDLSNFVYLQDITSAANNFIKYGNLQATSDILKDIERGVTFDKQAHKLKFNDLSFALLDFSGEMDTCRGSIIQSGATVKKIRSRINSFLDLPIPDPIKDILKAVMQKMNAFSSEPTLDNVVEAIWWCSQNGMMQQAYTLAEEYIITVATDLLKTYLDPIIVEEDEKKSRKKSGNFLLQF